jgi:hypothetical protein
MSSQTKSSSSSNSSGLAIASLVLGILSLCGSGALFCSVPLGLIGGVLGVLGINTKGRSMAIAWIVLSAVGLLLAIIIRVAFRSIDYTNLIQRYLINR